VRRRRESVPFIVSTNGRVALYFAVRYLTAPLALAALALARTQTPHDALVVLLTAQTATTALTHIITIRAPLSADRLISVGMLVDIGVVSTLVALTGGPAGPLTFLIALHAAAAGILLSMRAGVRALLLGTAGIVTVMALSPATPIQETSHVSATSALWLLAGAATVFSGFNERELRRRNAELATIRQVSLDIEASLSLHEISDHLCRGVVEAFRFDAAAMLRRTSGALTVSGAHGVTGATDQQIEIRGRLAQVLALGRPLIVGGTEARKDSALLSLLGTRGYVAVPVGDEGLLVATRSGRGGRGGVVRAYEVEALERLAHHARLAMANATMHETVQHLARTDPLTGIANHGEFFRRLDQEFAKTARYSTLQAAGHNPSLILLDIDQFKRFNDRFGHQAGDAALRSVAIAIQSAVRSFDIVARYGGEEFAVILPGTPRAGAIEVAERIRRAVAAEMHIVDERGRQVRVTISGGVASAPDCGGVPAALVGAADRALYRAKEEGRNRIIHAADRPADLAPVLAIEPRSRRRTSTAARTPAGERPARGRSSPPKRRTPHA
jgi:two-component system, cell cycle response regulator